MKKTILFLLLAVLLSGTLLAQKTTKDEKLRKKAAELQSELPDSAFTKVYPGNLIEDGTYLQLAREGWSTKQIFAVTDDYLQKNRTKLRGTASYGAYTKEWKPYWYMLAPNDTIKRFSEPEYNASLQKKINKAFKASAGSYQPRLFYTPNDRLKGVRNKGYFRHNPVLPSGGRIHWIVTHPTDSNKLMVIPDGDAIWRTDDAGRTWNPVTDRIPDRFHRSQSNGYCIPVDPDDWNHYFAFMSNGNPVYETFDGGETWARVPNATHKSFKRGYGFKDAQGTMKFIGVERNTYTGWAGKLWVSDNKGVTWREVILTNEQKDSQPDGSKAAWLQEFAFDPVDRNTIYITTARGILRSTDGMAYVNGRFNLERMSFKVYNQSKTQLLSEGTSFPVPTSDGPMMIEVHPKDPNKIWVALGQKGSPLQSAVFYSDDKGQSWITLRNSVAGIGSGQVFGNEAPGGWLGGFAVNFTSPLKLYGCSMSSAKSSDGGKTFTEYAWGNRMKGFHPNGQLYEVSCSRHNADNHMMVSTPSGRIFRASDGGMLMIDPKINNGEWTNISGDMGQILFYRARVNEFGDNTIVGNTQDIDIQTYRYGRWGNWRGYEGSTVAINPISNETYYSGGGGGTLEGTSWGDSWIEGIGKADVVTGNWYLWRGSRNIGTEGNYRDIGVVKDVGRSVQPLTINTANTTMTTRDFALCRDTNVGSSLIVLRNDLNIVRFDNESTSYVNVPRPTFSNYKASAITVNPDNIREMYIADDNNGVLKTVNGGFSWTKISSGIPTGVAFNNIYYHEGSGDIYAVSASTGIFLLRNGESEWQLWMKGYNPAAFGGAQINYATQEMMIYDYGRGIWIADLETPADRFFKNGFKIKQLSNINTVRTFGIDTKWDIPMYYKYEWTVNGQLQAKATGRYFTTAGLAVGDKVQLRLTLREAPDVSTLSTEFVVAANQSENPEFGAGKAIRSTGTGRIDLGHFDFFNDDFTVEMWVKPVSTDQTVLIGNRKFDSRDQQGWVLGIFGGNLTFKYAPKSVFPQPTYETQIEQDITVSGGVIPSNKWSHVALTVQRNGLIKIYLNGVQKVSRTRLISDAGLNSTQPLSLLADGYEYYPANATIDELKIWNRILTIEEVRKGMTAIPSSEFSGMVYYNDFNAGSTDNQKETFTRKGIRSRIRAEVSYPEMPMAVAANHALYDTITPVVKQLMSGTEKVMSVQSLNTRKYSSLISRFDNVYTASTIRGMTPDHYDLAPSTYKIDIFDILLATDSVEVKMYFPNAADFAGESIFMASSDKEVAQWVEVKEASYLAAEDCIVARFKTAEINGQLITVVKAKPAIGLSFPDATAAGLLPVFRESQSSVSYNATLLKSMPAPEGAYHLISSRQFVQPGSVTFGTELTSAGSLTFNADSLGAFNQISQVTISGSDNRMIPFELGLQNKIAPVYQGQSLMFNGGGATIGTSADYAGLHNSNTVTVMGWVRIDDPEILTSTSVRPLIFFRGGGSTMGIHLDEGEIRCHWNEESWSWGLATGLTFTANEIGRWVHVAMVTTASSISFYMNGRKFTSNRSMNRTRVLSPLMLGRNNDGDTWFKGAFDQVLLWNRSLTEAEVMKFMHERAYADENGLVASLTMDTRNESGSLVEMKSNSAMTFGGAIEQEHRSAFPFGAVKQSAHTGTGVSNNSDAFAVQMPSTLVGSYYLTQYGHMPYNYVVSGLAPAFKGFFSVNYPQVQSFTGATDSVTFICRHNAILKGDVMRLAIRDLGVETAFVTKATATALADGVVQTRVPASDLKTAFEGIWLTSPANLQVVKAVVPGELNTAKIILRDDQIGIPIEFERTSTRTGGKIDLIVRESNFATFETSEIDLSVESKKTVMLRINRDAVNPTVYNDVQVSFVGAAGEALNFSFALEPLARISLVNGTSDSTFRATSNTATLELKAELLRGVFDEPVNIQVSGDLTAAVSIGTDYLTSGGNKRIVNDNYVVSINEMYSGWTTASNPYLFPFLMSKQENRIIDGVSSFMYRFDQKARNFFAYDTRYFDSNMLLRPLEGFLMQTNNAKASLQLMGSARDTSYNRRNTAYFVMSQEQDIELELWLDTMRYDRTTLRFAYGASDHFVFDEDAPKILSTETITPQIYTVMSNEKFSINTISPVVGDIVLGVRTYKSGTYKFKVTKATHDSKTTVHLFDETTGESVLVRETGDIYTVDLPATMGTNERRFKLRISTVNSNGQLLGSGMNVWAEYNRCFISGLIAGAQVTVYDAAGRVVADEFADSDKWSATLATGVFVIRVIKDNTEFKSKVIIQ
ncbi:MAG: hypothetical protein JXR27_05285 [Paludibacteraceae bacterium]|nr:hypothetical protein [Paludibacteraceae bacterium]